MRASRSWAPAKRSTRAVFARFAARLSYVQGDFGDAGHLRARRPGHRRRTAAGVLPRDPAVPVRHGDQGPVRGRADRATPASWSRSRSAMTSRRPAHWPPTSTSTSTSPSSTASITSWARWAWRSSSTCASPTRCSSRSGTATTSRRVQITMAESFGVEDRGHFYDRGGGAARRGRQPPDAAGGDGRDGGAGRRRRRNAQGREVRRLPLDAGRRPRALRARAVRRLSRHRRRRRRDSTTETYAALRLEIDNWRWAGVPFFIRTGKRLPVTQTELRLVFQRPPRWASCSARAARRSRASWWSSSTRRPACG